MSIMSRATLGALVAGLLPLCTFADAIVFTDYDAFMQAAGAVQTIDFETLPDGSPTIGGEEITPAFNYTNQGVTFSSPLPRLYMTGNSSTGFNLTADAYPLDEPNWVIADLAVPASAVGVWAGGTAHISAYDAEGNLIASGHGITPHSPDFFGIVSDTPIVRTVGDDAGGLSESLHSYHFTPIPEPTTLGLLFLGALGVVLRKSQPL